jgi:hypothetical protein
VWAAGGINASLGNLDPDDRWEIHAADTVGEGHFVNDPRMVEILAREAPRCVLELTDWGCPFSLTGGGELNQRYFGAQSFRRTCFAGDKTGEAILGTLVTKAKEEGVPYREDVYVTKLLKSGGRVNGAAGFDLGSGRKVLFGTREDVPSLMGAVWAAPAGSRTGAGERRGSSGTRGTVSPWVEHDPVVPAQGVHARTYLVERARPLPRATRYPSVRWCGYPRAWPVRSPCS